MRITGILLSFNDERFVSQALESALAQDYEPLEIIVSDDASTDGTFEILERRLDVYKGPHQVSLFRQQHNTGSKSAHLNAIVPKASGDAVTFFDGDDVSNPSRVRRANEALERSGTFAVYSGYSLIDREGHDLGRAAVPHPEPNAAASRWFASVNAYASGGTLSVRRAVFEKFGALDPDIHEDVLLPFRASLLGDVDYIGEPLVKARRHESLTQSYADFASFEHYRARHLAGIERAKAKANSRLADIARAETLGLEAPFNDLRDIVARSLEDCEVSRDLVDDSLHRRLRALWTLTRSSTYHDAFGRDLLLAMWPGAYVRYKRFRLGG